MQNTMRRKFELVSVAILLTAAGCARQEGMERVLVSGSVAFKGAPVGKGQIRFVPQEGTAGPVTIEPIENGAYSTDRTGGVPVGTHRIEILGYDPEVYAKAPKGPGSPPIPQLLPRKYNLSSELTTTLESGAGSKTLDFDLTP